MTDHVKGSAVIRYDVTNRKHLINLIYSIVWKGQTERPNQVNADYLKHVKNRMKKCGALRMDGWMDGWMDVSGLPNAINNTFCFLSLFLLRATELVSLFVFSPFSSSWSVELFNCWSLSFFSSLMTSEMGRTRWVATTNSGLEFHWWYLLNQWI